MKLKIDVYPVKDGYRWFITDENGDAKAQSPRTPYKRIQDCSNDLAEMLRAIQKYDYVWVPIAELLKKVKTKKR